MKGKGSRDLENDNLSGESKPFSIYFGPKDHFARLASDQMQHLSSSARDILLHSNNGLRHLATMTFEEYDNPTLSPLWGFADAASVAGDGEVFQLKKSSLSQKLSLSAHPVNVLPVSLDQATITPRSNGAPIYDQAYLSQLKASTPSSRRATVAEGHDADVSMDLGETSRDDVDTAIPSESSILSAKQERERMQTHGTEDDFISLSVTKRDTVPQGRRRVREIYQRSRVHWPWQEFEKTSKRKDAMQEMIADADEEDEETVEWEREQLRPTSHEVSPTKQVYKPAASETYVLLELSGVWSL
ncbi:uncharacterized protein F5891DRAFT_1245220 [Suillus fuscotomentosus]|uniref:Uncharacterized protein n=1 Tax=Suillus fuscotomentosus TaxID=1912939 RepID=A0AAD4HGK5_9AGAM|nr:uncharacterized protein F5891DRAFT_1245220 [Suillus fuscotomentosus]KAG1896865.1 hypothetical protein F5891DRAFT_1245220 [Suillus fuscotomentosus]